VIQAHGRAILVREDISAMVTEKYLHRDHLGSITAITSSTGGVLERLNYDAWGQRRVASTWQAGAVTTSEHRGYTGHEHLDDIGVIHMNGRVYSPSLGRMLSPDPVTQSPENGQNYNRYTYVFNNPLRYTDPSGYRSTEFERNGTFLRGPRSHTVGTRTRWAARADRGRSGGHNDPRGWWATLSDTNSQIGESSAESYSPNAIEQLSLGGPPPEYAPGDQLSGDSSSTASTEENLVDYFDDATLRNYADLAPVEFVLFMQFAIEYPGIADDQFVNGYFEDAFSDFDRYARREASVIASEAIVGTQRAIYGQYFLRVLSGPVCAAIGGVSDTFSIRSLGSGLSVVRQATDILFNGTNPIEFVVPVQHSP
jgi:RHS repeat-associated protein